MRTASCTVLAPENRARPIRFKILNLLLSNALFRRARLQPAAQFLRLSVTFFCNYCVPREQLAVCKVTRPLFPCD